MLDRVGLADRAKEKAETFSGGMQRRLELAKGCCIVLQSCCWTSLPPASILGHGAICGNICAFFATKST